MSIPNEKTNVPAYDLHAAELMAALALAVDAAWGLYEAVKDLPDDHGRESTRWTEDRYSLLDLKDQAFSLGVLLEGQHSLIDCSCYAYVNKTAAHFQQLAASAWEAAHPWVAETKRVHHDAYAPPPLEDEGDLPAPDVVINRVQ